MPRAGQGAGTQGDAQMENCARSWGQLTSYLTSEKEPTKPHQGRTTWQEPAQQPQERGGYHHREWGTEQGRQEEPSGNKATETKPPPLLKCSINSFFLSSFSALRTNNMKSPPHLQKNLYIEYTCMVQTAARNGGGGGCPRSGCSRPRKICKNSFG